MPLVRNTVTERDLEMMEKLSIKLQIDIKSCNVVSTCLESTNVRVLGRLTNLEHSFIHNNVKEK